MAQQRVYVRIVFLGSRSVDVYIPQWDRIHNYTIDRSTLSLPMQDQLAQGDWLSATGEYPPGTTPVPVLSAWRREYLTRKDTHECYILEDEPPSVPAVAVSQAVPMAEAPVRSSRRTHDSGRLVRLTGHTSRRE